MDFKIQPNGLLSFYNDAIDKHVLMDSAYNIVDEISYAGYSIDFHDFYVLDNGNYLLLGNEYRLVDMDTVVPGGHPGVTVSCSHIQIQNPQGDVVFEWSGWYHFQIIDSEADLLDPNYIDISHTNAVDMDSDSTLVISNRNMNEITKINIISGDITWRLGGKNNQFTYTDHDTLGFAGQHDIRYLPGGIYQMFDNGWNHDPVFSCALQLDLDEENMIADVVRRVRSEPDIMGWIMGSAQQLDNGHMMVGWGSGDPNITEFDADNNKILEFSYDAASYRAFKFPWETTAFSFGAEELTFQPIQSGGADTTQLAITNNLNESIGINRVVSRTGKFFPSGTFPIYIAPGETGILEIEFSADTIGNYEDVLTIGYDVETTDLTQRIAKQISVHGEVGDTDIPELEALHLNIIPNPATSQATVRFSKPGLKKCRLFDVYGNELMTWETISKTSIVNLNNLPKGIYLLNSTNNKSATTTIKIIKQ